MLGYRGTSWRRALALVAAVVFAFTTTVASAVVGPGAVGPAGAAAADGIVDGYGVPTYGAPTGVNQPPLAIASTATGKGYWIVSTDGGIFSYGDAAFYGSTGNIRLNRPVIGMAATPSGAGYWLVASDGGIFAFGDALFYGSTGDIRLNKSIVGMAATPSGHGYWLVAYDGGIFAFGDAQFYGSTGAIELNSSIVGMAATPAGDGYWLVSADGGIFNYGLAGFYGSAGDVALTSPVVGMTAAPNGKGYRIVTGDGAVYSYGSGVTLSSTADANRHVVSAARPLTRDGLWLVSARGSSSSECTSDGVGDVYGPRANPGQIDFTSACLASSPAGLTLTFDLRTPRSRAEIVARMKAASSTPGGNDFVRLNFFNSPRYATYLSTIEVSADGTGPYAVGFDDDTLGTFAATNLTVSGAQVTIGPIPESVLPRSLGGTIFWELELRNYTAANGGTGSVDFSDGYVTNGPIKGS